MKNQVCIIIPIYKENLTDFEIISIKRAVTVLNNYEFKIVTYKSLNTRKYQHFLDYNNVSYSFELFDKSFFSDIDGYNSLMLSLRFYKRFEEYEYILIYQLDAYVFRDELETWCNKGYDYVGAPWIVEDSTGLRIQAVGNGGFSLRKVSSHIRVLKSFRRIVTWKENIEIYQKITINYGFIRKLNEIKKLLIRIIFRNNTYHLFNKNDYYYEDIIWSRCGLIFKWFNVADFEDAIKFSFEKHPQFLFRSNNNQLPFGCHAWDKHDFKVFWKNHIKI